MSTEKRRKLRKDRVILIGGIVVALIIGIVYFAKDRNNKTDEKADKPQVSEKTETNSEETKKECDCFLQVNWTPCQVQKFDSFQK